MHKKFSNELIYVVVIESSTGDHSFRLGKLMSICGYLYFVVDGEGFRKLNDETIKGVARNPIARLLEYRYTYLTLI